MAVGMSTLVNAQTSAQRILENVYEIKSVFGNRYVQQYLFVGESIVLLDAGVARTPETAIFPVLEKLGLSPAKVSIVIAMHADADHHGGLPAIKDASRSTLLACHADDLELIENPESLYSKRYNFLAREHGLGFGREGMVNCPEGRRIDMVLAADETLQIAPDWRLHIWHVPGHSAGHLAVYDEKNRAAFTSDAVQAAGYPTTDGKMAFGPTYYTVDSYLATVAYLENKPIEHMFSGHWPAVHGAEVQAFLRESRRFVETADALVQAKLRDETKGVTLKSLLAAVSPKLGTWPAEADVFLQFAIFGHLVRLQQRGVVRASKTEPVEYRLV
jgi:glyoxylase-like metal-dependent hydrolase (beta-lactamase superfamily II)